LSGGGSLLRGLDRAISEGTGLTVRIADEPLSAVVRGAGLLLEDRKLLKDVSLPMTDRMR
jgi:rod shape-determining protein MreB